MILSAEGSGSEIEAVVDCVVDDRSIGHRQRVLGSRAASEVNPSTEVIASLGSIFETDSSRVTHVAYARRSFPGIRFQNRNPASQSTVFRSARIPILPNKSPEPTATLVTPPADAGVAPAAAVAHL